MARPSLEHDFHSRLFAAPMLRREDNALAVQKVLIANRGEIACRVIKTCRLLGIASVAIYVDEDVKSLHIGEADEAIGLGSIVSSKLNPYLDADAIIKAALETRADAIHPGYGYLSEQATFADNVRRSGLIFIGPRDKALSTLGDKRQAKEYLAKYEPRVPLVPGYAGKDDEHRQLLTAAEQIGYPLMIKASAGGGGKGMRVVYKPDELADSLERARSEAQRSFGSRDCILEKYVAGAKHIEIQIMGDQHGTVICFFERDCSVQRRHQKIIEEGPCAWLSEELRNAIMNTASMIGNLLEYEGAGTVEFLIDVSTSKYYFLEVNARLQVEHPITEEITGIDLVALQLFVAAGGRLDSLPQLQHVRRKGHAIECRLCAEDPRRDFVPQRGTIARWSPSALTSQDVVVRYETAIRSGSEVSIHFDSMIAKVIVWATDRPSAIRNIVSLIRNLSCIGVKTNQLFLQACLLHPAFQDPAFTTSFIPQNSPGLFLNPYIVQDPDELNTSLALPALMAFEYLQNSQSRSAFGKIKPCFRSLPSDPFASPMIVVTELGLELANSTSGASLAIRLPETRKKGEKASIRCRNTEDMISTASTQFNMLSREIRNGLTDQWEEIRLTNVSCLDEQGESRPLVATIGTRKIVADVVLLGVRADGTREVMCHSPTLGTWTTFRSQSLLAYFSARAAFANDAKIQAQATRECKATMPGKIIDLLKVSGDTVSAGDAVLLLESMKMETNVCVGVGGKVEILVHRGDSVQEGEILCKVH